MICKQAGYCSLGFNHASGQGMSNIDTVFATMTNGIPTVLDAYCQSKRTIPVADTDIGGTNDFLEYNGGIYNSEYHYKVSMIRNIVVTSKVDKICNNF